MTNGTQIHTLGGWNLKAQWNEGSRQWSATWWNRPSFCPYSNFRNFKRFGSMALKGGQWGQLFQEKRNHCPSLAPSQAESPGSGVPSTFRAKPSSTASWKDLCQSMGNLPASSTPASTATFSFSWRTMFQEFLFQTVFTQKRQRSTERKILHLNLLPQFRQIGCADPLSPTWMATTREASIFPYGYWAQPRHRTLCSQAKWVVSGRQLNPSSWIGSNGRLNGPQRPFALLRLCFPAIFSRTGRKGRFRSAGREVEKENKQNGETAGVRTPEFLLNFVQGDLTSSLPSEAGTDGHMALTEARLRTPAFFLEIRGDSSLWSWTWYTNQDGWPCFPFPSVSIVTLYTCISSNSLPLSSFHSSA